LFTYTHTHTLYKGVLALYLFLYIFIMNVSNSFIYLFKQPFLNPHTKLYTNILSLNCIPNGPLAQYIQHVKNQKLSEFVNYPSECIYAVLKNDYNSSNYMTPEDLPHFLIYLKQNNYVVHHSFNEIVKSHPEIKSHICLFSYAG